MRELTMDELTMRELTLPELRLVSGGWSVFGAAATLGLTLAGIAGIVVGVVGAPFWAVVAGAVGIGVAATAGLVYAYDAYKEISETQQTTPSGVITIEELQTTSNVSPTEGLQNTTSALGTSTDLGYAEEIAEANMGYITEIDEQDFGC